MDWLRGRRDTASRAARNAGRWGNAGTCGGTRNPGSWKARK